MQQGDAFFFKLLAFAATLTMIGVLTWMFGMYILLVGGAIIALGAFRFLIAPALPLLSEASRLRAEADKIIVESDLVDAQRAQAEAQTAIIQQQAAIEMQRVLRILAAMPDAYEIRADANGLYPQFIGPDGRLVGYVPTQLVKGRPASLPPGQTEEDEDDAQENKTEQKIYLLSEQIERRETQIDEKESIIGYDERGQAIRGTLFEEEGNFFDSMMLYGDQGAGKSSGAVYFAGLTILHHGYIIVIDPDHDTKQSLLKRLGPLAQKPFLLCEPGIDPDSAQRALEVAELEMKQPGDYPVLLIGDESTMMFREAEEGGEWQDTGLLLRRISEDYATRGRKRRRRVMLLGQITKAGRSGNTEVRGSLAKLVFKLRFEKAQIIFKRSLAFLAEIATRLFPGQALVLPDRAPEDSYKLQFPLCDERGLQMIVDMMRRQIAESSDTPRDVLALTPEVEHQMFLMRVQQYRAQGINSVTEISKKIFGVTRGSDPRWPECRDKIISAIEEIEQEEQYKLFVENGGQS